MPSRLKGKAASSLGNLNAAHASTQGMTHAAPNSMPGQLNAYAMAMRAALAIKDPVAQQQAIAKARAQLSQVANKPVSTQDVGRVDSMLGIRSSEAQMVGADRN